METVHPYSLIKPTIDLRYIFEICDNVLSLFGLLLNSLLLYCIKYKTSTKLMEYRPILIQNCLIDMFYNFMNFITKTQTEYKDGYFYMMLTGTTENVSLPWNMILIITWVFALFYTLTALPVQFLYRYFLICHGMIMTRFKYCLLLLSAFFAAFLYGISTMITFWPDEGKINITLPLLLNDSYYYNGIPHYVVANIDEIKLKMLFTYCYILVIGAYIIVIFTNYKVWKHLKLMENHITTQMKDVHRQITKTLAIQAIVPFTVCLIPVATAVTFTFLHLTIPGVGVGVSLTLCWIPVANPSLTMFAVKNYRRTIFKNLKKLISNSKISIAAITNRFTSSSGYHESA